MLSAATEIREYDMSQGWVSLWRELFEKPIWLKSSPEHKVILIALLGMVNHEPKEWEWKGQLCSVERGQKITSAKSIIEVCGDGVSRQNVRGALLRFGKLGFLTIETTKAGSKITICNYKSYQNHLNGANQDSNQQVTNDQPTGNQRVTTNNNVNKDNNVNKEIKISTLSKFISAKNDILSHAKELYPDKDNDTAIADFIEACEIKGYKYKMFDRAFYKWVREDRFNQYGQKSSGRKCNGAEEAMVVRLVSWWSIIGTKETLEEMDSKARKAVKQYGTGSINHALNKMNNVPRPNLTNFWAEVKR